MTIILVTLMVNGVAAIVKGKLPMTVNQILWENILIDLLSALALSAECPTKEMMEKRPVSSKEHIITKTMLWNCLTQALYQIVVLMLLYFKGASILDVEENVIATLIFNTFIFCQVCNLFNSRSLEKKNVLEDIHKKKLFLKILVKIVFWQVILIEVL